MIKCNTVSVEDSWVLPLKIRLHVRDKETWGLIPSVPIHSKIMGIGCIRTPSMPQTFARWMRASLLYVPHCLLVISQKWSKVNTCRNSSNWLVMVSCGILLTSTPCNYCCSKSSCLSAHPSQGTSPCWHREKGMGKVLRLLVYRPLSKKWCWCETGLKPSAPGTVVWQLSTIHPSFDGSNLYFPSSKWP